MAEDVDALSAALAKMMQPRVLAKPAPRPKWEATKENARREAAAIVEILHDYRLTEYEQVELIAGALLVAANHTTPRRYGDEVTEMLVGAIKRQRRKEK